MDSKLGLWTFRRIMKILNRSYDKEIFFHWQKLSYLSNKAMDSKLDHEQRMTKALNRSSSFNRFAIMDEIFRDAFDSFDKRDI